LEEGDIIIDGGNSEYQDTQRRTKTLAQKGLLFVGSGVSGGEEGARYGPSLMPGGNPKAWPNIKNIFQVSIPLVNYCIVVFSYFPFDLKKIVFYLLLKLYNVLLKFRSLKQNIFDGYLLFLIKN